MKEEEETKHYIGRTFFALFEGYIKKFEIHKADRMMYVGEGTTERGFFEWIQAKREALEKEHGVKFIVIDCKII